MGIWASGMAYRMFSDDRVSKCDLKNYRYCHKYANCSASFGKELDVHAGGVDLQFPHHENEIAQCTACYYGRDTSEAKPWPRIFVHTGMVLRIMVWFVWLNTQNLGHLHIHGQKMSKSLKNFVSIEDFLKEYSANDFRMFCLLHKYNANMEYRYAVYQY